MENTALTKQYYYHITCCALLLPETGAEKICKKKTLENTALTFSAVLSMLHRTRGVLLSVQMPTEWLHYRQRFGLQQALESSRSNALFIPGGALRAQGRATDSRGKRAVGHLSLMCGTEDVRYAIRLPSLRPRKCVHHPRWGISHLWGIEGVGRLRQRFDWRHSDGAPMLVQIFSL